MLRPCQTEVRVQDASQIGEARRAASRLANTAGMDAASAGRLAIVVTELATNVLRHGGGGSVLLHHAHPISHPVVEVMAIDAGAGMHNIDQCMVDGYSTRGTPGNGLGAVSRLSDFFDVYSQPGAGTVVVSRVGTQDAQQAGLEVGAVCLPYPGEQVCGDGWLARIDEHGATIMVVDGLGHGLLASEASDAGLEAFAASPSTSPSTIVTLAHERMHATRGGAVAVARLDTRTSTLRYAAVGNIAGSLVTADTSRGLFTQNGTVGAQIRQLREIDYAWTEQTLMILHSDGLATRWQLSKYPGLTARHPSVIAGILYRDFTRGRDDVTVLVARVATVTAQPRRHE